MGGGRLKIEEVAGAGARGSVRGGGGNGQINHRLERVLVERDVPVGILFLGEGFEADLLQVVEGGEALARGVFVTGVAEGAEDMGVLVACQAVG